MEATDWAALYGAALSSLLAGWTIYRDVMTRGRLEVVCSLRVMAPDLTGKQYFTITATNVGQRVITITGCYGQFQDGQNFVMRPHQSNYCSAKYPQAIHESQQANFSWPDVQWLRSDLKSIYVGDSTGKKWKASKRNIQEILKQARENGSLIDKTSEDKAKE